MPRLAGWGMQRSRNLRGAMDKLFPKFLDELFIKYRDTDPVVGLCMITWDGLIRTVVTRRSSRKIFKLQ
jgi:hypothetical protein